MTRQGPRCRVKATRYHTYENMTRCIRAVEKFLEDNFDCEILADVHYVVTLADTEEPNRYGPVFFLRGRAVQYVRLIAEKWMVVA